MNATDSKYPDIHPALIEALECVKASVPPAPDPAKEEKHLRDWFAGQALAGWLASYGFGEQYPVESADVLARCLYVTADAMMKARDA